MPHRPRRESSTRFYHIYVRGINKEKIFGQPREKNYFKRIIRKYLKEYDLVISNHTAVHADLQLYEGYKSKVLIPTLWNTLYRTQFLGCCMAFHRRLLSKILPFPQVPLMHDIWIGLMALKYGRIGIIQEPLLLYRRHGGNASVNLEKKSSNSLTFKILYRFYILKAYLNG